MEKEKKISYKDLLTRAQIFDYSKVKGSFILPVNGLIIWKIIEKELDKSFSKLGIKNVLFPTIIPLDLINKEKKHLKGFLPELFFVNTKKDKESSLVLRPTSEVVFHEWFKEKLITHKNLPFLYNQWGQVFRNEKNVSPFLRNSEFLWQEGHTLHQTKNEALSFSRKIINLYEKYSKDILGIKVIKGKKTFNEKFAGSKKSYTLECILPNGYFLQLATSHFLSDNFSKIFEVKFRDSSNVLKNPFSTSWGTSSRALGALALTHNDGKNITFPFKIAPIQIGLVFIEKNSNYEKDILKVLNRNSLRWKIYKDNNQFSLNLRDCEYQGCPIVLIIGKKEWEKRTIKIKCSFINSEEEILFSNLRKTISEKGKKITSFVSEKKSSFVENHFFDWESLEEKLKKSTEPEVFIVSFCNRRRCEKISEKKISFYAYSFRCIPFKRSVSFEKCIFCQSLTLNKVYIGKSY